MSLLDVFVILAYYDEAEKNLRYSNKITKFKFNNKWVISKLDEISNYHSSPLHWNLKELRSLPVVVEKQIKAYSKLEEKSGVEFHSLLGLNRFQENLKLDLRTFMESSRNKAQQAQSREILTLHQGERLISSTKSAITITNFLGGNYFFTVDEVVFSEDKFSLIESKHSNTKLLPSKGDIKDGLLKMILYSNLEEVSAFDQEFLEVRPILKLTSPYIKESLDSNIPDKLSDWCKAHSLSKTTKKFIQELFQEAKINKLCVEIVREA